MTSNAGVWVAFASRSASSAPARKRAFARTSASVAVAAEEGGADAVSLINTVKGSAIDPGTGEPALAAGHGGLSGPAVKPVALHHVRVAGAAGVEELTVDMTAPAPEPAAV